MHRGNLRGILDPRNRSGERGAGALSLGRWSTPIAQVHSRRYVYDDKNNKCNLAYLEKPRVQGQDGKLRMRARFSGEDHGSQKSYPRESLTIFTSRILTNDALVLAIDCALTVN